MAWGFLGRRAPHVEPQQKQSCGCGDITFSWA
jgi:hypothetical protein